MPPAHHSASVTHQSSVESRTPQISWDPLPGFSPHADVHVPSQQSPSESMAALSTMEKLVEGLPFQSFSSEGGGGGAATPNLASSPTPNIQHYTPLPPHSPNISPLQNISMPRHLCLLTRPRPRPAPPALQKPTCLPWLLTPGSLAPPCWMEEAMTG